MLLKKSTPVAVKTLSLTIDFIHILANPKGLKWFEISDCAQSADGNAECAHVRHGLIVHEPQKMDLLELNQVDLSDLTCEDEAILLQGAIGVI